MDEGLTDVTARIAALDEERERLEADIERVDGQISPLADRRAQLDQERRTLTEKIEGLEDVERRHRARIDLLEARRRDIEETPGSRFLGSHEGHAIGLLRDLVSIEAGLERALVAALGPLADAVVYEDGDRAVADAPEGDGAIFAIARGGPVALGLRGERALLSVVEAEPAARGIASTVLRDVYLVGTVDEAVEKQGAHPAASFVTPEGVLIGPAVIHTAKEADARAREIRAELKVLDHDLAATRNALKPTRARLDEIGAEVTFLQEQVDAADADITSAAERLSVLAAELAGLRKEEEILRQRVVSLRRRHGRVARAPGRRRAHAGGDAGAPPHAATAGLRARRGRDAPPGPVDARRPPGGAPRRARRAGRARSDPAACRPRGGGRSARARRAGDAEGRRRRARGVHGP